MKTLFSIQSYRKSLVLPSLLVSLSTALLANITNADDICYETPTKHSLFGVMFVKTSYPIKNLTDSNLTDTEIFVDTSGLFKLMDHCSIDGGAQDENCDVESNYGFGPVGIFSKGAVYHFDDILTAESTHTADQKAMIDFLSSFVKVYATYVKDGEKHEGEVYRCGAGGGAPTPPLTPKTGLFDAWDVSRDNSMISINKPDDINISTETSKKTFKLSLASLAEDNQRYEPKASSGGGAVDVQVSIYPKDSTTPISNSVLFWPATAHKHQSNDINVTSASKDAVVGFKFCATYEAEAPASSGGGFGLGAMWGGSSTSTTSGDPVYHFYNSSQCSASTTIYNCDAHTAGTPTWHLCSATDHLAIRPDHFVLSSSDADFAENLRAGHEYNLTVIADDFDGDATQDYNQTSDNIAASSIKWLNTNPRKRNGDGATLPSSANPTFKDFNMTDGVSSVNGTKGEVAQLSYDDIGFVTLEVNDTKWAEVDEDDTPANCDGRYICGDKNVTFIPDHFAITNIEVNNSSDGKFTYLNDCNDSNNSTFKDMSARVGATIVAQNEKNGTTENFTDGFYEQELNVTFGVSDATHGDANKTTLVDTYFGFGTNGDDNGTKTIKWNEENLSKALRFNFHRETDKAVNPFEINGSNVTLDLNTTYGSTTIKGGKNGDTQLDGNATFVYGQAHAGTQRYQVPDDANYTAHIYYEVYCFGNDCDTNLIKPINPTLKHLDDIRWYKNMDHNVTRDGNVTAVFEKDANEVNATTPTNTLPSKTDLTYSASVGYPYTTTMQINASSWLLYNEGNANATANPFQVEFNKANTGWGGKHETNTSTSVKHTTKTNGRVMW